MTARNPAAIEIVPHRFTENGCEVTAMIAKSADAQKTLYGTVTRDGVLVGSYFCADRVRQSDWRFVLALGIPLTLDCHHHFVKPVSEAAAVHVLTTIFDARDSHEADRRICDATFPPR